MNDAMIGLKEKTGDKCEFCDAVRVNEATKQLECRANPPTALVVMMNTMGGMQPQVVSAFPPTSAENWCAQFESFEEQDIDPPEKH